MHWTESKNVEKTVSRKTKKANAHHNETEIQVSLKNTNWLFLQKNICDLLKIKKILRTEFDFWKRLAFSLLIQIFFRNSNTWCLQPKKTRQETILKTNYKSCQINYIKNRKPEFQVTIQLQYSYNTIAIQIQYSYNTIQFE